MPDTVRPRSLLAAHGQPLRLPGSDAAPGAPHWRQLWTSLQLSAEAHLALPPYLPRSVTPWRAPAQAAAGNCEYELVERTGRRVLGHALVAALTGDPRHVAAALTQAQAAFNVELWPRWHDLAHPTYGVDLRTGALGRDLALAYDWLHPLLSAAQRAQWLAGLDQRAIQPYLGAVARAPAWLDKPSNWLTCIVGGLGCVGLILKGEHPDAQTLCTLAQPRMERYLQAFGPAGEFNEAVGYANAIRLPVIYFQLLAQLGRPDEEATDSVPPLARWPFPQNADWLLNLTLPPGRLPAFGDSALETPVDPAPLAAIAAATGSKSLQWFYQQCAQVRQLRAPHATDVPLDPRELLWFDPTLPAAPPAAEAPRSRWYPAHGGCWTHRSHWDDPARSRVVYGKLAQEDYHTHHDAGQLCLDAAGQRLIVDLGKPGCYPREFFTTRRYEYYVASTAGHNVLQFDQAEQRPGARGALLQQCGAEHGCAWVFDLTAVYEQVLRVTRTVLCHDVGVVAVLDEADLPHPRQVRLRWHTAVPALLGQDHTFQVRAETAHLQGVVQVLDQPAPDLRAGHHAYTPPLNVDRLGQPLPQAHEPFVEVSCAARQVRLLSLFAVGLPDEPAESWRKSDAGAWMTQVGSCRVAVAMTAAGLTLAAGDRSGWRCTADGQVATW